MKMTLIVIAIIVAVLVALYQYGNSLRKKKKELVESSGLKQTYEAVETERFTVEEMLKWFKSHNDVDDKDEYVLSRLTQEALKNGGINIVMPNIDVDHSFLMIITDSTHKKIKHARITTYSEVENEILDMLGDKNLIILE